MIFVCVSVFVLVRTPENTVTICFLPSGCLYYTKPGTCHKNNNDVALLVQHRSHHCRTQLTLFARGHCQKTLGYCHNRWRFSSTFYGDICCNFSWKPPEYCFLTVRQKPSLQSLVPIFLALLTHQMSGPRMTHRPGGYHTSLSPFLN